MTRAGDMHAEVVPTTRMQTSQQSMVSQNCASASDVVVFINVMSVVVVINVMSLVIWELS